MGISARKQGLSNAVFPLYFALEEAESLDCLPAGKLNCDFIYGICHWNSCTVPYPLAKYYSPFYGTADLVTKLEMMRFNINIRFFPKSDTVTVSHICSLGTLEF